MTEPERRAGARIPVQMWVEESSAEGLYFQRAANLSEGGIFLERTIPHPVGTLVNLQFTLPDEGEPLRVRAEIVNAAPGKDDGLGMGLRFVELPEPLGERIRRFIARHGG